MRHIHLQGERAASHGFYFVDEIRAGGPVAEPKRNFCARVRQSKRYGAHQATRCAGLQRDLAIQIKVRKSVHACHFLYSAAVSGTAGLSMWDARILDSYYE